ncbi:hypothetical protein [Reichenbachiella sp. MALMAid0571]|uniref:hypothetical protein n=1 Tax=Reichenbachiella sp. MALMAid0571 TaxID=3143939 RepID=UPI0032DED725
MKISISYIIPILLIELSFFSLSAQEKITSENGLKEAFETQVTNIHQEKVFVHTDRQVYITGETIWMSAYCVDASFHLPQNLSKVLNVELFNSEGKAVKQERIQLIEGLGKGQIFVSSDIQSGVYIMRAYTNWMKNFEHGLVFQKQINIVNPISNPDTKKEVQQVSKTLVNFFPEGGNLVNSLKSKVAVKINDNMGQPLSLTGVVYDNNDNEVAKFSTSDLGYTYFHLTPQQGKTYIARIARNGLIEKHELPKAQVSGIVIQLSSTQKGDYELSLSATKGTLTNGVNVIIQNRGVIQQITKLDLKSQSNLSLPVNSLKDGISQITCMDDRFNPLAERLLFKFPENPSSPDLKLDKTEYSKREKIILNLKDESLKTGDSVQVSLSVFRSERPNEGNENIISNLLLTSDIKGEVRNSWIYFDSKNKSRQDQMDLVMLTHGWRRFVWKDVLNKKEFKIKYPAEMNAPVLSGELNKNTFDKLPKSVLLNFLGKTSVMSSMDIDDDGIFHFELPFRLENKNVYFLLNYDTLSADQISLFSPFDLKYHNPSKSEKPWPIESKTYLEALNTNIQISQVYRDYNNINGTLPQLEKVNTHFYGKADYEYLLDNYTRFETVRDLFIEYIRSAVIRRRQKQNSFHVYNDLVLPGRALTMIDGIPIWDADFVLNFDPLKVEKIDVVNDLYYVGNSTYSGIINFTTYKGDFAEQELPDYLVKKAYHGLQQSREFYAPDYQNTTSTSNRIPDYRNTLYWNPNITITNKENLKIEFFTSDDLGEYTIEINGVTNSGKLIYHKSGFRVRNNLP